MPKNKMSDLRNHLFETLEALKDEERPMDLQRAKAIRDVAQTLIDSARVEVQLIEAMDGVMAAGEFFQTDERLELEGKVRREMHQQRRIA